MDYIKLFNASKTLCEIIFIQFIVVARSNTNTTVYETKCCGIMVSLFYIDLTIHYIQHFENLT